jgi:hypothetical protein
MNKWRKAIVDEATGKEWCNFTPTKEGVIKCTCEFLHETKQRYMPFLIYSNRMTLSIRRRQVTENNAESHIDPTAGL